jgi:serine/threonine-protein kinase
MGEIFLARLEGAAGFEKLYVVKRILPHLADDARFRQMLISEAQIAAKMAHANICQVYELGETSGQLYIVMEYLEGVTMLPILRRASKAGTHLDFGLVAAIATQTCDALHYAHELKDRDGEMLGLVHRDVTPSNVFLTDSGVAKVLDFGIAKAKGASSTSTEDGAVKGKYAYMAPEQLRGGAIDRRVDLFALGVVLYEMLALRRLFQRKTDYLTFRAVMEQPIPDIRRYRPDIPDGLANVIARMLDREPANRFDTARQVGSGLLDALNSAGMRPWTQGDIGDYVKTHFAHEIGKRSKQVASAVHRTAPGDASRSTMPLIVHEDSHAAHEGDDDDLASVETDIDSAPRFVVANAERPPSDPFAHSTPPPFAAETTGSSARFQPVAGSLTNAPIVVVTKRSLLWPILAVAMILVAGGALFLVWKQMQNQQQQQPPAPIIVTQEPAPPPPSHELPREMTLEDADKLNPPNLRKPVPQNPPAPRHYKGTLPQGVIETALRTQQVPLNACLAEHGQGVKDQMIAQISIAGTGKAASVQISPATLNAAPVGACIRNVIMATPFPTADKDTTFSVPLKPKTT